MGSCMRLFFSSPLIAVWRKRIEHGVHAYRVSRRASVPNMGQCVCDERDAAIECRNSSEWGSTEEKRSDSLDGVGGESGERGMGMGRSRFSVVEP